jgi:hypothetical protein
MRLPELADRVVVVRLAPDQLEHVLAFYVFLY